MRIRTGKKDMRLFLAGRGLLLLALVMMVPVFAAGGAPEGAKLADEGPSVQEGRGEARESVVAKVNGVDITAASLKAMMSRMDARKGQGSPQTQDGDALRKEALDRLIFQELAYQKARTEGLTVDQKDLDSAMTTLKAKVEGEEGYKAFLEKERLTEEELRSQIERGIMVKRFVDKEVLVSVDIAEDDLRKEYEKEKDKYVTPEKLVVTDIVFFLDTHDKESLRKAEEILRKVKDDQNKDPWKLTPDGTFVVREMQLSKEGEKELYEEAKKLKAGDLSGIIVTPDSLHAIRLEVYTPAKQFTLEEVRTSLQAKLTAQAHQKRLHELGEQLKKGAKIEILETGKDSKGEK